MHKSILNHHKESNSSNHIFREKKDRVNCDNNRTHQITKSRVFELKTYLNHYFRVFRIRAVMEVIKEKTLFVFNDFGRSYQGRNWFISIDLNRIRTSE